jgi:phage terminase large subunit-like protein
LELWLIVGRRGGKDSLASLIAVNAARFANVKGLRPGETALVACLATDNVQAGIVFNYIKGYFQTVPDLMPWVSGKIPESARAPISLVNRTEIRITTNNFRAPRGYPFASVILDEVATWKGENSTTPDIETYRAILPGLGSIPGSMLIGISSPYRKQGILYDKWKEHFGENDDDVLVIQGDTRKFNPTWSQAEIDKAVADDTEAASAEWLAKFREDLADYVDRDLVGWAQRSARRPGSWSGNGR